MEVNIHHVSAVDQTPHLREAFFAEGLTTARAPPPPCAFVTPSPSAGGLRLSWDDWQLDRAAIASVHHYYRRANPLESKIDHDQGRSRTPTISPLHPSPGQPRTSGLILAIAYCRITGFGSAGWLADIVIEFRRSIAPTRSDALSRASRIAWSWGIAR